MSASLSNSLSSDPLSQKLPVPNPNDETEAVRLVAEALPSRRTVNELAGTIRDAARIFHHLEPEEQMPFPQWFLFRVRDDLVSLLDQMAAWFIDLRKSDKLGELDEKENQLVEEYILFHPLIARLIR